MRGAAGATSGFYPDRAGLVQSQLWSAFLPIGPPLLRTAGELAAALYEQESKCWGRAAEAVPRFPLGSHCGRPPFVGRITHFRSLDSLKSRSPFRGWGP